MLPLAAFLSFWFLQVCGNRGVFNPHQPWSKCATLKFVGSGAPGLASHENANKCFIIKLYLNTRFVRPWSFTNMLKNKQPMPVNIRASMQQQQQLASARNRRLAQQMENRPSVQAALKLKQVREWVLPSASAHQGCQGIMDEYKMAQGKSWNWCSKNFSLDRYQLNK